MPFVLVTIHSDRFNVVKKMCFPENVYCVVSATSKWQLYLRFGMMKTLSLIKL